MVTAMARFTKNKGIMEREPFMRIVGKFFNMMDMSVEFTTATRACVCKIFATFPTKISLMAKCLLSPSDVFGTAPNSQVFHVGSIFPIRVFGACAGTYFGLRDFFRMFYRADSAHKRFAPCSDWNLISVNGLMNKRFSTIKFFSNIPHGFFLFDVLLNKKCLGDIECGSGAKPSSGNAKIYKSLSDCFRIAV